MDDRARLLAEVPFFNGLAPADLALIAAVAREESFAPGATIFRGGLAGGPVLHHPRGHRGGVEGLRRGTAGPDRRARGRAPLRRDGRGGRPAAQRHRGRARRRAPPLGGPGGFPRHRRRQRRDRALDHPVGVRHGAGVERELPREPAPQEPGPAEGQPRAAPHAGAPDPGRAPLGARQVRLADPARHPQPHRHPARLRGDGAALRPATRRWSSATSAGSSPRPTGSTGSPRRCSISRAATSR